MATRNYLLEVYPGAILNVRSKLEEIGLTQENSVVIGSGILQALGLRESNDISWGVLGKDQSYSDLADKSVVIEGVRYITVEFMLAVKKSWLNDADVRKKDIADVKLIESYLAKRV